MSKAIRALQSEHEAILSSLTILDAVCASINSGATPPRHELSTLVAFVKKYVDRLHHGKEEQFLFPALLASGVPEPASPVAALLSEHLLGRDLLREMDLATRSGPDYLTFEHAARGYLSLLRNHVQKENGVLFPMAETSLDKERLQQLNDSLEDYEHRTLGPAKDEELNQRVNDLQRKYLR